MAEYHLTAPLKEEDVLKLRVGDTVYLSGPCFTCRSKLQRYIFDEHHELPFRPEPGSMLIHTGPIVVRADLPETKGAESGEEKDLPFRREGPWKLMSIMPTSSIRFEKWGPASIRDWNLRLICGKTTMGAESARAMQEHKCVHVSPQSVSPMLWLDSVEVDSVDLFEEMGSIEAPWHMMLKDFGPFIVDMDCFGGNYFDTIEEKVYENREKVYRDLGIPDGFRYTRLYDNAGS